MAIQAPQQAISIGTTRLTYLPDGEFYIPPIVSFPETTLADWQDYKHLLRNDGQLVGGVGAHVIQTGTQTILVDAGNGPHVIEREQIFLSGGELLHSLARAGLTPDDINIVFYTHLHIDHVGWTGSLLNGTQALTFPRAHYLVRSAEWHRFDNPVTGAFSFGDILQLLAPRIEFIEDGESLVPGVTVLATPGHTSGHASLVINSGGERAFILGDAFHNLVEIEHPEWVSSLDSDAQQTEQTRRSLLKQLAQPHTIGTCIHFPNSAFGRTVLGEDATYHWQAIQ